MQEAQERTSGRRSIDRVLDEHYLDGLDSWAVEDVRRARREAEQEEADLSYLRRLLQGRTEIVRAELTRRGGVGGQPAGTSGARDDSSGGRTASLVDALPGILADGPRRESRGSGRFLTVEPTRVGEHRRAVEQVLSDLGVSDVSARSGEDLRTALAHLERLETDVSADRRRVQQVMDACTGELTRRYRDGVASVDELLADRVARPPLAGA